MENGKSTRPFRGVFSVFGRPTIRMRIAASILLAFVLVLPAVGLSLFYFTDLLSSMKILTERDVRLARTGSDLAFFMLDIQRTERNYRIFGDSADSSRIARLVAGVDSILAFARTLTPPSEKKMVDDLAENLSKYSEGFRMLASYVTENPPEKRLRLLRSQFDTDSGKAREYYRSIRDKLESAGPALRDSLFEEAILNVDVFSLDRIVGTGTVPGTNTPASLLQQTLDSARRDFIQTAHILAGANWALMEDHAEESLRIEARAKRNIIFTLIMTAALCIVLVMTLPRSIIRPVAGLVAHIHAGANGENEYDPAALPKDEVGELALAYDAAMEKMHQIDDLKTRRIASQKRFIDRLLDYLDFPVCILTKTFAAIYMNARFAALFGQALHLRIPDGGLDLASISETHRFVEDVRAKIVQNPGDFTIETQSPAGGPMVFRCRPVRNAALNLETILVVGVKCPEGKDEGHPCGASA